MSTKQKNKWQSKCEQAQANFDEAMRQLDDTKAELNAERKKTLKLAVKVEHLGIVIKFLGGWVENLAILRGKTDKLLGD
jgi:hypothetical protein